MTMDSLRADLKANIAEVLALSTNASPEAIVGHLQNTLWPFLQAVAKEMHEMDECIADLVENAEDILQPETAAIFQSLIVTGLVLANRNRELAKKLKDLTGEEDPNLETALKEYEALCARAQEVMSEIVVVADDEEDDDDEHDALEDGEDDDEDEEG